MFMFLQMVEIPRTFAAVICVLLLLSVPCHCQIPDPTPPECENVTVSEVDVGNAIFSKFSGSWQRPRLNALHPLELEKDRIIRITAYLALRWFDEFHVWNTTYPLYCVPYIVVQANDVWRPDVAQMNSQSKYALMDMPGEKIRLHSNGFTTFSPGGTFDAFCDFDFTLFPFDTQKCSIQLESWRYTRNYVSFALLHRHLTKMKLYQFHENDQWQVVDTRQQIIDQEYTYKQLIFDRVEFTIWIRRKSAYYLLNIVAPSVIISIAQISTFSLQARETAKMELSFTCLLAYSVFQLQITDNMPHSSDHVPFLSIYIDLQMFYIALSMLGQGLMFVLLSQADDGYHDKARNDVPKWLYSFGVFVGRIIFVSEAPVEREDEIAQEHNIRDALFRPLSQMAKRPDSFEGVPGIEIIDGEPESTTMACNNDKMNHQQQQQVMLLSTHHGRSENAVANMRCRWIYMAAVTDRFTFVLYMVCIIFTPILIFAVAPFYKSPILK